MNQNGWKILGTSLKYFNKLEELTLIIEDNNKLDEDAGINIGNGLSFLNCLK